MPHSLSGALRRTVPAALALALLPMAAPSAAEAATSPVACGSTGRPALATQLSRDIGAAVAGRAGTVSVGLWDRTTGTWCGMHYTWHYDSASVVKAIVMQAVLRRAMESHRTLSSQEDALITAMITRSDNDATTTLWRSLGRARVQRYLQLAGLTHTTLDAGGAWGLTRITAQDELRVLALLDSANTVLSDASRAYGLRQMANVVGSQRWGTPAGAPAGIGVHVKNGWLPRATHGWRVHSIGAFTRTTGPGYRLVVLTQDNGTMGYGVTTIERIARVVHHDLNPGAAATTTSGRTSGYPGAGTPARVSEQSDGSDHGSFK
ncbi:serine hydrolase [Streptomyces sp. NPDC001380]|uniref:serine hydrolase n=1 Tax=Streptomyces sp. NPDC001380 TaxID=3364566 RepID=UPI0036C9C847